MAATSAAWHLFKNLFLVCLSLALLSVDTALVGLVWAARSRLRPPPAAGRKTVLVTGVAMSKGLCLARLFHRRGHRVVAANAHWLAPGRASAAVDVFYALPRPGPAPPADEAGRHPYVRSLVDIVRRERVDLWVSVSDVAAAAHDALARDAVEACTEAKAVQLGLDNVQTLHQKDRFMRHVRGLGLPAPETRVVTSRRAIVDFLVARGGLRRRPGARRYLVKPVGVDDVARFNMTPLPLATEEETLRYVDGVPLGGDATFVVQEYVGGPEFCTHALVVGGRVRAFVACPS